MTRDEQIQANPFARHPKLKPLASALAADASFTVKQVDRLLLAHAKGHGIGWLDVEVTVFGESGECPFAVTAGVQANSYDQAVQHHLAAIRQSKETT